MWKTCSEIMERAAKISVVETIGVSMPAPDTSVHTLRLGARGSLLSRQQSMLIARQLEAAHPGLRVELVIITTSGDTASASLRTCGVTKALKRCC